jgi:hypothetical protein
VFKVKRKISNTLIPKKNQTMKLSIKIDVAINIFQVKKFEGIIIQKTHIIRNVNRISLRKIEMKGQNHNEMQSTHSRMTIIKRMNSRND